MRIWWTDPAGDGSMWQGPLGDTTTPYTAGDFVTLPDGEGPVKVRHAPAVGLYEAIEDNTAPDNNSTQLLPKWLVALQGTLGDQAARARETRNIRPKTIDEIHARLLALLAGYAEEAYDLGTDPTLPSNGVWATRTEVRAAVTYLAAQNSDPLIPGVTTTADRTVFDEWFRWAKSDGPALNTSIWLHFAACNGNSETHEQNMQDLVDAGDRDGLIAYEPQLLTGWPAPPTPQPGTTSTIEYQWTQTIPLGVVTEAILEGQITTVDTGVIWRFLVRHQDKLADRNALVAAWQRDERDGKNNGRPR